ncbi:MAG TPA: hypothetical protein PKC72_08880 [Chitinophagaceae bacterium]|nr:hypothetical protein [Chitinophagaceae bacterium]
MIQQATAFPICQSAGKLHNSRLTLIKGQQQYQQQLNQLTALAWQITYTALWNGEAFSAIEKEKAQELVKEFISRQLNPCKAFSELVQRVLLARQYISTHPGTYAPVPTQWFSPSNKNGFAGTCRWYEAIENTRHSIPAFRQALKAFPEAVLETVQSDSANDFHYWRSYFSDQDAQSMLNLFLAVIANIQNA